VSAYDNDPRVTNLSDEDFTLYVVDDGNGRQGRVECSMPPHWAASWAGEKPRFHGTFDEAIRSLIGDPQ
jgi:hypothetical protein